MGQGARRTVGPAPAHRTLLRRRADAALPRPAPRSVESPRPARRRPRRARARAPSRRVLSDRAPRHRSARGGRLRGPLADVVQWQNMSFPSSECGFDSRHPLRSRTTSPRSGDVAADAEQHAEAGEDDGVAGHHERPGPPRQQVDPVAARARSPRWTRRWAGTSPRRRGRARSARSPSRGSTTNARPIATRTAATWLRISVPMPMPSSVHSARPAPPGPSPATAGRRRGRGRAAADGDDGPAPDQRREHRDHAVARSDAELRDRLGDDHARPPRRGEEGRRDRSGSGTPRSSPVTPMTSAKM